MTLVRMVEIRKKAFQPAIGALCSIRPDDDEAGHDADHADDDMKESERLDRHTQDHGELHCSARELSAYRLQRISHSRATLLSD